MYNCYREEKGQEKTFMEQTEVIPLSLKKNFESKFSVVKDTKRMKNIIMKKSYVLYR